MEPAELVGNIRKYCRANASQIIVKKYSKYFTEGYDAYGLTAEKFNSKVSLLLEDKSINMELVINAGNLLIKSGKYEETCFAICLL